MGWLCSLSFEPFLQSEVFLHLSQNCFLFFIVEEECGGRLNKSNKTFTLLRVPTSDTAIVSPYNTSSCHTLPSPYACTYKAGDAQVMTYVYHALPLLIKKRSEYKLEQLPWNSHRFLNDGKKKLCGFNMEFLSLQQETLKCWTGGKVFSHGQFSTQVTFRTLHCLVRDAHLWHQNQTSLFTTNKSNTSGIRVWLCNVQQVY